MEVIALLEARKRTFLRNRRSGPIDGHAQPDGQQVGYRSKTPPGGGVPTLQRRCLPEAVAFQLLRFKANWISTLLA